MNSPEIHDARLSGSMDHLADMVAAYESKMAQAMQHHHDIQFMNSMNRNIKTITIFSKDKKPLEFDYFYGDDVSESNILEAANNLYTKHWDSLRVRYRLEDPILFKIETHGYTSETLLKLNLHKYNMGFYEFEFNNNDNFRGVSQ